MNSQEEVMRKSVTPKKRRPGNVFGAAIAAVAAIGGGCEGPPLDGAVAAETSVAQALVWTSAIRAPYASASPTVFDQQSADRTTGRMSARSGAFFWDDDSSAWLESAASLPSFVDSAAVSASVDVTGGHVTAAAHLPFGWASAGAALWMHVRSADGLACEAERILAEKHVGADEDVPRGTFRLSCALPAGAVGPVTVRVGMRTWASAFGEAHSEVDVHGTLTSISLTKDSGAEDGGDVLVTDSVTGTSLQVDDTFGTAGDHFEIGRVMFTDVSDTRTALLAIDRTDGSVTVGDVQGDAMRPAGGIDFSAGADLCGPGRICLVADVQRKDGRDELVAFDQLTGRVRTFRSNGSTHFLVSGDQDTFHWCGASFRCHLGDVNGDGAADVVRMGNRIVDVALNDGSGSFGFSRPDAPTLPWTWDFCRPGERCTTGQLDDDGRADLVSVDAAGDVWTSLSTAPRSFGPRRLARAGLCAAFPGLGADCQVADVNGDGRADAVRFFHDSGGFVWVALSDGTGGFAPPFGRSTECRDSRICRVAPLLRRPGAIAGRLRGDFVSIIP
jgi:hypothetical protein